MLSVLLLPLIFRVFYNYFNFYYLYCIIVKLCYLINIELLEKLIILMLFLYYVSFFKTKKIYILSICRTVLFSDPLFLGFRFNKAITLTTQFYHGLRKEEADPLPCRLTSVKSNGQVPRIPFMILTVDWHFSLIAVHFLNVSVILISLIINCILFNMIN